MKEQKKSSWGAVLVSFLKEFLLNSFEAPGHLYYDENLTNEGKRKKNYIWRVLLLVTAVGVALLPVIAWNMFVPDVLWAKIVTVVVCEGYVVFIVSMEIIQIKDELKEDMLKIGGYKITPKGSISLFKEIDFKIAQTEYSYTILISKKPLKWLYKKFYVTIYGRHGKVKKIELVRADKKYFTKYETMNGTVLEKLQEENVDEIKRDGDTYKYIGKSWSQLDDYDVYLDIQTKIGQIAGKTFPIEWEGSAWMDIAKKRSNE